VSFYRKKKPATKKVSGLCLFCQTGLGPYKTASLLPSRKYSFPSFTERMLNFASMRKFIYLDHNASTPVDKQVLETMLPYFSTTYGNAASRTHAQGWIAAEAVNKARNQVAELLSCEAKDLIFTSGATEAANLAIRGVYENYSVKGKHIITVATEHPAVLDTCRALEKQGAELTILPVDRQGMLDLFLLERSIRADTILVCIMSANNETGVIHPIDLIAGIVHTKGSLLFCDGTQAAGKIRIDLSASRIGLFALSAHKLYGPKGTGALYISRKNPRVLLAPQLTGGGHEGGLRSGTLNVPAIVGFGEACRLAQSELWERAEKLSKLRTKLEQFLLDIGGVHINGNMRDRLPNTSNIFFEGVRSDQLIVRLNDIGFSTGSACASASQGYSHVLLAMQLTQEEAKASVRFSLGKDNTEQEIDYCITHITAAITELREKKT
jgi:cysteine desulfurase